MFIGGYTAALARLTIYAIQAGKAGNANQKLDILASELAQ